MLDDRPVLRERILATATFSGIALATVFALDFIVTGGFDLGARRSASTYFEPLLAASITAPPPSSTVTALAWTDPSVLYDPRIIEEAPPVADLIDAGATNEPGEQIAAPSEEQLYREIEALYAEQDARAAQATADIERLTARSDDDAQPIYDARDLNPDPTAPDTQ
jgi:hypothetical protein